MFGIRTPTKETSQKMDGSRERGNKTILNSTVEATPETEAPKVPKLKEKFEKTPKEKMTRTGRLAEAKSQLMKAKLQIKNSRNLKTEIKEDVISAVERLYQLVKEAEEEREHGAIAGKKTAGKDKEKGDGTETKEKPAMEVVNTIDTSALVQKIDENMKILNEFKDRADKLNETLKRQQEMLEGRASYASVAAGAAEGQRSEHITATHSIIVTSKNEMETGEEVMTKLRNVVNAKEEGVRVEKIRKAKDRKIIVGFRSKEDMQKAKEKLREGELNVEDIKNKDPLIVLKDVFQYNTNEDILKALRNQNKSLFKDIGNDDRVEIKYRRKARNQYTCHVIMKVSPQLWNRLTRAETVHIDLQKVRVFDQSPLVQCSRCLGYGHTKRFCEETQDACSHCDGKHLKSECPLWLAESRPECCNCRKAKLEKTSHNAFSSDCPVRKRWETIARSTIAYC